MFIEDFKKDFYEYLYDARVLVFASLDVDSVCATKILLNLLRIDNIPYTLVIVEGINDLQEKFKDYVNQAKIAVLINCGGTVDLLDLFGNPTKTIFFLMDNHRPFHILNVYNESKLVRIVSPPAEDDRIPAFSSIFQDEPDTEEDSDEDEDDEEEDDHIDRDEDQSDVENREGTPPRISAKRKRAAEVFKKRKLRSEWEEKRRDLLHTYTEYNYRGAPASIVALEIAWSLGRAEIETVWWAIVGLTDFITMNHIDRSCYTLLITQMQNHVSRIHNADKAPLDCLKITFENEPNLYLYRQWNLYDSMKHSPHFACKFKSWTSRGTSRFHLYLAEIGIPLVQAREKFTSMDLDLRRGLKQILAKRERKYELEDLNIGSFLGCCGYKYKYTALDNHIATLALLETPSGKTTSDRFMTAMQSLSKDRYELLESGIVEAKIMISAIYKQVVQILQMKLINVTSTIMYVVLQEGGPDSRFFIKPNSLVLLAKFILNAFSSHRTGRRHRQLALVVISPPYNGTCIVVGIPPITADVSCNLFGNAFEKLKARHSDLLETDCFDPHICRINSTAKESFLENLVALLA